MPDSLQAVKPSRAIWSLGEENCQVSAQAVSGFIGLTLFVGKNDVYLPKQGFYSLGSFHIRLDQQKIEHGQIFEELFRVWPRSPLPISQLDAVIRITESSAPFRHVSPAGAPPILRSDRRDEATILTDSIISTFDLRKKPIGGEVVIRPEPPFYKNYPHYLLVTLNKFLFLTGRLHIHAAAINYQNKTCVFIGEKGSGKSTISLTLARAGGTILAEDHVMLRRSDNNRFLVSGCDGYMRITAKTEKHYFPEGIDAPVKDFAGELKKEFALGKYFKSMPYTDFPVDFVFFPQQSHKFQITPMSTVDAINTMVSRLRNRHRFGDPNDMLDFIEYLGGLFGRSKPYQLGLSNNLEHLSQIIPTIEGLNENYSVAG